MADVIADSADSLRKVHPDIFNIAWAVNTLGRNKYPEISQLLPFTNGWEIKVYSDDNWIITCMFDDQGRSDNHLSQFLKCDVEPLIKKLTPYISMNPTSFISSSNVDWHQDIGAVWYDDDRFTYIRSIQSPPEMKTMWDDVVQQLSFYLDLFLLPKLFKKQREIFNQLLPKPASYNLNEITPALWVLECDEECSQGTAFMLEGVGLISCAHVIGSETKAFRADNISEKYPIKIIAKNDTIDLAILEIDFENPPCLPKGTAENVAQQDSVAVIGFPNYRLGDSGVINVGQISGFRTVSAIRRLLVNTSIVAGNSGGPVLNSNGAVIGVAVTGADRMENVPNTENHGVVPIDALVYLT